MGLVEEGGDCDKVEDLKGKEKKSTNRCTRVLNALCDCESRRRMGNLRNKVENEFQKTPKIEWLDDMTGREAFKIEGMILFRSQKNWEE